MKHLDFKRQLSIFSLFPLLILLTSRSVFSQSNSIILKGEQHWETYCVGGTCIPSTHNVFLADVDEDGTVEIITGGFTYDLVNGTRTYVAAPLKIWSWNGQNFTLEKSHKWTEASWTMISCVYADDLDNDGKLEIITAGTVRNETINHVQLRVWHWDGEILELKTDYEWADVKGATVSSVCVDDIDKDGIPELITAGRFYNETQSGAQLRIWHWNSTNLIPVKSVEWCARNQASANSVYVHDLDNDGVVEVITGGYDQDLENSSGQLCIWQWNGESLFLRAKEEWRLVEDTYALTIAGNVMGNTIVNNLKVGDVDGDGAPEIATGGFSFDGEKVNAQLRVWSWDGQTLTLEDSSEWANEDITEVKSVSINDVDHDGLDDVVTSGFVGVQGGFEDENGAHELAQLRVWSLNESTLTLKESQEWYIGEGECAWNLATGDLDQDGLVEIVTVGCTYVSEMCDPDMRVWFIPRSHQDQLPYTQIIALVIVAAVVLLITLLVAKKLPIKS